MNLTDKQKEIVDYNDGCCVVKACPGSGKTFSVALRMLRLLKEKKFNNTGIAAMSFTNVAADEIKEKLIKHSIVPIHISYPHYLGTIDKFINTYIFLPFGHLIMECGKRPELVGKPHRTWTKGKGDRKYTKYPPKWELKVSSANPHGYFDCTSFDINNELYPIVSPQEIHFSLKKEGYYKLDKSPVKRIQEIIDAKWENFKLGYATQADANYIAWKVLENYPLIASAIANRFRYFIVDEAQDTDAIQMRIIEILKASGANNFMLIGDRDQSIYEWNNADPNLFDEKYSQWNKVDLDENWRSSQNICNFSQPLSSFAKSFAVSDIAKYDLKPIIMGYKKEDLQSMNNVCTHFFSTCQEQGITLNPKNVAIIYRGKAMGKYIGITPAVKDYSQIPWEANNYHVRDIVLGKLLTEQGDYKAGYRLLEKGYFEAQNKPADALYHCSSELISEYIQTTGFTKHRDKVNQFISLLPPTKGLTLNQWIQKANLSLTGQGIAINFTVKAANSNISVDSLLEKRSQIATLPYYTGTIHSIKGKTFEAVLLLVDKRAGAHSFYETIFAKGPKPEEEEELRAIYVAITRPRKVLMLAVPDEDISTWSKKLG